MLFFAVFRLFDKQWKMLRHPYALLGDRALRGLAVASCIIICVFTLTQIAFYSANWLAYGKFVGVDLKERNFQRALRAIDSVRSGDTKPFVSITHAAMQSVDSVSPAFASLAPYFDGPGKVWETGECPFHPSACGEIGAGWFVWALRGAAASTGHYSSPSAASAFFGRIADEIMAACNSEKLECRPQLIAEMPPVRWPDVLRRMLPLYTVAFHDLLTVPNNRSIYDQYSVPSSDIAQARALRFLNYPLYSPPKASSILLALGGWYYCKTKDDWITVEIRTPTGEAASFNFERQSSPDVAEYFGDSKASTQRFSLNTQDPRCNVGCKLILRNYEGTMVEMDFAELHPMGLKLDKGQVQIERVDFTPNPEYALSRFDFFCHQLRSTIITYYNLVFLPVFAVGLIAFLVATILYCKRAMLNVCFVLAVVSVVLLLIYISLIVLIDTTSFPAFGYLTPCYFLMVSAAVLFIAALLQLSGHLSIPEQKFLRDHATRPRRSGR